MQVSRSTNLTQLRRADGTLTDGPKELERVMFDGFEAKYGHAPPPPSADVLEWLDVVLADRQQPNQQLSNYPSLTERLSPEAIKRAIRKLGNGKSTPDNTPGEILKWSPPVVMETFLDALFILIHGGQPLHILGEATTSYIYKKNDPDELSSWRPVSAQNPFIKAVAKTLQAESEELAEKHGIIAEQQKGFRIDSSCHHQVATLAHLISDAQAHEEEIWIGYIDLSDAYGCVDHQTLLEIMV
ncbi:unnamed protein product [Vitrella brassicaformis CCMP3155]|uniref:Uncharacterized protein n=1 Tax=Vitrella brassicaformis (strain CCMP3155) TaxID=1169540 RepID=A0A0G4E9L1_VITBC|nr:unnamed protein product [Vitrella brassicaformis CCMP3155]|eukprot:CEL92302.1 unnamed protein product [Vitrella brassicaformis CCMP3155]